MMGRIGLSWVVSGSKGDSNGAAIEPIPYKTAQGVSPSNKLLSYRLNGHIEPIPYKKAQGVSPSNKLLSYRLNPSFVSSAVRNVMLGALDKAALPKARLRWLGACGLARIRHQPPEP